jgi:DNA-nicking Smr family endonuclease
MKEEESIYKVFRELADLIREDAADPAEAQGTADPVAMPEPEARQPDEYEAFLEAMKDVRKVDRDKERVRGPARDTTSPRSGGDGMRIMGEILKDSSPFNVINLPEYMEGYVDDINPLIIEKLRNGEFSIQKVLDLHGLSAQDACEEFHAFLGEAVQSRLCCVKVIHGRGLRSRQGPVLKEKLKEWIVRAMHRKWVVAFASSGMADGGPGATTILLRTRAQKKRLHVIG